MNEFKEFDNENYELKKSDGLRKNGAGFGFSGISA